MPQPVLIRGTTEHNAAKALLINEWFTTEIPYTEEPTVEIPNFNKRPTIASRILGFSGLARG